MNTRILFALTSQATQGAAGAPTGYYVPEAAQPWAILRDAGFDIEFVSTRAGRPPAYGAETADEASREFMASPEVQARLAATPIAAQLDSARYAGILYVGGHGTMWDFPHDAALASLAADIYEAGGIVGAVCHGPAGLVNLTLSDGSYLVSGKRVAAFTDDEERAVGLAGVVPFLLASTLQARGAIHVPAANWASHVVVDGRLVTGQNPASAAGVGQAMARLLLAAQRQAALAA